MQPDKPSIRTGFPPRNERPRSPNGSLQQSGQIRDRGTPEQRERRQALVGNPTDHRAGFALGVVHARGLIDEDQCLAGLRYAELYEASEKIPTGFASISGTDALAFIRQRKASTATPVIGSEQARKKFRAARATIVQRGGQSLAVFADNVLLYGQLPKNTDISSIRSVLDILHAHFYGHRLKKIAQKDWESLDNNLRKAGENLSCMSLAEYRETLAHLIYHYSIKMHERKLQERKCNPLFRMQIDAALSLLRVLEEMSPDTFFYNRIGEAASHRIAKRSLREYKQEEWGDANEPKIRSPRESVPAIQLRLNRYVRERPPNEWQQDRAPRVNWETVKACFDEFEIKKVINFDAHLRSDLRRFIRIVGSELEAPSSFVSLRHSFINSILKIYKDAGGNPGRTSKPSVEFVRICLMMAGDKIAKHDTVKSEIHRAGCTNGADSD